MKLNRLLLALIVFLFAATASAQNKNPFETIGKQGKIITLTKGSYDELFDKDSIQQVGSVLINIRTMKVVKLIDEKVEVKQQLEINKHSRFLSTDPLTRSFPMLTPYQYASNRPIDGIDLDGLEYISYTINIDMGKSSDGNGGKVAGAITNSYYVWNNANQHNSHGILGQGVLYKLNYYNGQNLVGSDYRFISRNAAAGPIKKEYGNYMGATSLFHLNQDGLSFSRSFDYDLPAVDQVDFLALQHDRGYDNLQAVGANSLFNDWGTTPVDEDAMNGWNSFLGTNKTGSIDPYNNQKVTSVERSAAKNASLLFSYVINSKKADISYWMQSNYKGEAANHTNKGMYSKKDLDYNYQLFRSKYMEKNDEGQWSRKAGMWAQDKDGNWTPNKPKSE